LSAATVEEQLHILKEVSKFLGFIILEQWFRQERRGCKHSSYA
jgi:hypothetical protein